MTAIGKYWRIALIVAVIAALIIMPLNFNRYGLFILSQWAVMTIAAMNAACPSTSPEENFAR